MGHGNLPAAGSNDAAGGKKLPCRDRAYLPELGSTGGGAVTKYSLGEFHKFEAAGQEFLYLVPSGGIVALEGITSEILHKLDKMPYSREELISGLSDEGHAPSEVEECLNDVQEV